VLDHRETHAQAAGNVMNIEDHKLSVIRDQLQINDVHGSAELAANPHPWWPSP
jgi:DnaJ-domain-containing protein 1